MRIKNWELSHCARYRLSEYRAAEKAFTRAALLDKDFEAAELMLLHVYVVRENSMQLSATLMQFYRRIPEIV